MIWHFLRTLFLIFLLVVIPLLPRPELLVSWPVIVVLIFGALLNLSQPPVSSQDLKAKNAQDRHSVLLLYIAGSLVFLVPVLDFAYGRKAQPSIESPWSIVGLVLVVGGFGFRYWSIRTLGKWFTSVVRVQEGQVVIQNGPYKILRHPSYLGAFLLAIGVSIICRSYAGLLVCFFFFFPVYTYRIRAEEETLTKELGAAYADYKKKSWRMLPFVY